MYHSNWTGNHFNAGVMYGKCLYNNGINPVTNIPISNERKAFVEKCIPIYKKYYPEILEEIKGMANGLNINYLDIANFLLSMYCYTFENKCSCFAFSQNGNTVFGRNSDFVVSVEELCDSAYYNLDGTYSFIGNTTAWSEMEDGLNEYGLAVGLTFIYPTKIKPGINAGMLVRYILEKCKTTKEAIKFLKEIPIASPQTITLADKYGDIAVVECNCDEVIVITGDKNFVFTTNHFNSKEMQKYQTNIKDEAHSHDRYSTLKSAFENNSEYSVEFSKDLLSGKMGFMCQYDRQKGLDTVWSTIYDLDNKKIYRAEGNPSKKDFVIDKRLKLNY